MILLIDLDGTLTDTAHEKFKPYKDGLEETDLSKIPLIPGAKEFISNLQSNGHKPVIISDSHPKYVNKIATEFFKIPALSLADKPNPTKTANYLQTSLNGEATKKNTVVVGDTWLDIELGRALNFPTILTNFYTATSEENRDGIGQNWKHIKSGPTYFADSFNDVLNIIQSPSSYLFPVEKEFSICNNPNLDTLRVWWNSLNIKWKSIIKKNLILSLNRKNQTESWGWKSIDEIWYEVYKNHHVEINIVSDDELKKIHQLETINCGGSLDDRWGPCIDEEVNTLEPLRILKNLTFICCTSTFVSSLEPLKYHFRLNKLYASATKIISMRDVSHIPISDLQILGEEIPYSNWKEGLYLVHNKESRCWEPKEVYEFDKKKENYLSFSNNYKEVNNFISFKKHQINSSVKFKTFKNQDRFIAYRTLGRQQAGECDKFAVADKYFEFQRADRTQELLQKLGKATSNFLSFVQQSMPNVTWDFFTFVSDKKTTQPPNKLSELFDLVETTIPKQKFILWTDEIEGSIRNQKDYKSRKEFVDKHIFLSNDTDLQGKNIIILDDQFTTGGTAYSICGKFIEKGVKNIIFVTLFYLITTVESERVCPHCGTKLQVKVNRNKGTRFLSCVPQKYGGKGCGNFIENIV